MATNGRRLAGFLAAVILTAPQGAAATDLVEPASEANPVQVIAVHERHLRSSSPIVLEVIRQASKGSETFRSLVRIIEASNGIVYVNEGRCQYGMRACLVSVTPAGDTNRILNVRVDTGRKNADLVRSIGHELYHATEVLGDRLVTDTVTLFAMYRRIGKTTSGVFETDAAIAAGEAVRREFTKSMTLAPRTPSVEGFNPPEH